MKKKTLCRKNNKEIYCTRTLHRVGSMYTRNVLYTKSVNYKNATL